MYIYIYIYICICIHVYICISKALSQEGRSDGNFACNDVWGSSFLPWRYSLRVCIYIYLFIYVLISTGYCWAGQGPAVVGAWGQNAVFRVWLPVLMCQKLRSNDLQISPKAHSDTCAQQPLAFVLDRSILGLRLA